MTLPPKLIKELILSLLSWPSTRFEQEMTLMSPLLSICPSLCHTLSIYLFSPFSLSLHICCNSHLTLIFTPVSRFTRNISLCALSSFYSHTIYQILSCNFLDIPLALFIFDAPLTSPYPPLGVLRTGGVSPLQPPLPSPGCVSGLGAATRCQIPLPNWY